MPELAAGSPAPDFQVAAVTLSGETQISLSDYHGKSSVVLYFYPKDDTPGCTTDASHAVAYGVWKEKTNYGKTYWGIERTTFVIDKAGKIAKIYPRVKVEDHVQKVLEFVQTL